MQLITLIKRMLALFIICSLMLAALAEAKPADTIILQTEKHAVQATTLANDLHHPWGLAFLPDQRLLITERSVSLLMMIAAGTNLTVIS